MSLEVRVLVTAPIEQVWSRWLDLPRWPEWNPACIAAEIEGDLAPGRRLRLELRHPRGRTFWTAPVVREVVDHEHVRWETRGLGFRAPTVTTFAPDDEGTLVALRSESRGLLGFTYRMTFPEKTQGLLWSGALTGLAQSFRSS